MKEIKFKAWDGKNLRKLIGLRFDSNPQTELQVYCDYKSGSPKWFKPKALLQYTGLKDKNGVEVFEGDILDFDPNEWGGPFISKVSWDSENAEWSFGGGLASDVSKWRQVIGNIYQNPEQLT